MEIDLHSKYQDIFESISDYALITQEDSYLLYHIKQQGYVMLEYDGTDLINLLIQKDIRIVSSQLEVNDPNYQHYVSVWDEEKNDWVQILEEDIEKYRKKHKKNKSK